MDGFPGFHRNRWRRKDSRLPIHRSIHRPAAESPGPSGEEPQTPPAGCISDSRDYLFGPVGEPSREPIGLEERTLPASEKDHLLLPGRDDSWSERRWVKEPDYRKDRSNGKPLPYLEDRQERAMAPWAPNGFHTRDCRKHTGPGGARPPKREPGKSSLSMSSDPHGSVRRSGEGSIGAVPGSWFFRCESI